MPSRLACRLVSPRVLALAALVCAGSAGAAPLVHAGAQCRSTGAATETATGELINDTIGANPGDYVTFICPMVLARNPTRDSATVVVIGATNSRYQQSYCQVRSMNFDGSLYHQDTSSYFATNNSNSKQVDSVSMTVSLVPGLIANSLHLRCRLTSNLSGTPKNSIIMYTVD